MDCPAPDPNLSATEGPHPARGAVPRRVRRFGLLSQGTYAVPCRRPPVVTSREVTEGPDSVRAACVGETRASRMASVSCLNAPCACAGAFFGGSAPQFVRGLRRGSDHPGNRKEGYGQGPQGRGDRRAQERVRELQRRRADRVPRAFRRAGQGAARQPRRDRAVPRGEEHADQARRERGRRRRAVPRPARRPVGHRVRPRRRGRGRQGPARLRQDEPDAGDQGRLHRRSVDGRGRDHQAGGS